MEPEFAEGWAGSKLRAGQVRRGSEIGGRSMRVGSDLEAGSELGVWVATQEWAESGSGGGAWANGPGCPPPTTSTGLWAERAVEKKPNSGRAGRRLGGACVRLAAVQEMEASWPSAPRAAGANAEVKPGGGGRRAVVCS